jgi:hypothetical protein
MVVVMKRSRNASVRLACVFTAVSGIGKKVVESNSV